MEIFRSALITILCSGIVCCKERVTTNGADSDVKSVESTTEGTLVSRKLVPRYGSGSGLVPYSGGGARGGTLGLVAKYRGRNMILTCATALGNGGINTTMYAFDNFEIGISARGDRRFFRNDNRFNVALLAANISMPASAGTFPDLVAAGVTKPNRVGYSVPLPGDQFYFFGASRPGALMTGFTDGKVAASGQYRITPNKDGSVMGLASDQFAKEKDCGAILFDARGNAQGMLQQVVDKNRDGIGDEAAFVPIGQVLSEFSLETPRF